MTLEYTREELLVHFTKRQEDCRCWAEEWSKSLKENKGADSYYVTVNIQNYKDKERFWKQLSEHWPKQSKFLLTFEEAKELELL